MIIVGFTGDISKKAGSVAKKSETQVLRTVRILKCPVIWNLTGNNRVSTVLAAFSLIVVFQVSSLRV